jgi:hypothetical protein
MATSSFLSVVWFVCFVCISQTYGKLQLPGNDAEWEIWKKFHGKVYENEYVENYRKAIWQANLEVSSVTFD